MLRSIESRTKVYVMFVNRTTRNVDLIWIDYQGKECVHKILAPYENVKVNTFRTHPWTFRDHETGEQMHYMHRPYYFPMIIHLRLHHTPIRFQAIIHCPVRSLRESCMWQILRTLHCVTEVSQVRSKIDSLDLPMVLKRDLLLQNKIVEKHKSRSI